ncbi:hypothetical protein FRUB_07829 [Fimbriiglobus ruber]|uniref:Uncharacterized protein n=1 Tax=Fimbriiglobus ruber TaxID=1908690 RepID=A0A225DNB0_9BACT|nr:hypothetical protein FRUB_07829 [Fimbriiglobus ruber]
MTCFQDDPKRGEKFLSRSESTAIRGGQEMEIGNEFGYNRLLSGEEISSSR